MLAHAPQNFGKNGQGFLVEWSSERALRILVCRAGVEFTLNYTHGCVLVLGKGSFLFILSGTCFN
jgi:hypothetical protein